MYGEEGSVSVLAQLIDLAVVAVSKLKSNAELKEENCETRT